METIGRATASANPLAGGLGRRLLIWFLVLSLVPLALSNALGYVRSQSIIESLVKRYLAGIAGQQAHHVLDELDLLFLELEAAAAGLDALGITGSDRQDPDAVDSYLAERMIGTEGFGALYVVDEIGDVLRAAPLSPSDLQLWFPQAARVPTGRLQVLHDSIPPFAPNVILAQRLRLPARVGPRWLVAPVSLVEGDGFLQIPEHIGGAIETFLLDQEGHPIFVSHPHEHIDYSLALSTPLRELPPGSFARYADRRGVEVIGTSTPPDARGWQVVMEVPVASALTELRLLRDLSFGLAIAFTLALVAAAWFVARGIVAPLRRLLMATGRVSEGDLTTRVAVDDPTEVGTLALAFNRMTEDLAYAATRAEELHEREIERAGQLATVGELAAGVAHEVKNPVAGILGGLDLVSRRTQDDPALMAILQEMRRALSRIDVASRDLLSFARPPEPLLAASDLNAIVEHAQALVLPASDSPVTIELDLAPDLPDVVLDQETIEQALVNLLMNAVQATRVGGTVRIRTSWSASEATVRVSDEGPGLSEAETAEIFRPFFTTKHRGTGLGLPITQGIVSRHGGRLEVESTPGDGATFTVTLPLGGPVEPVNRDHDPAETPA